MHFFRCGRCGAHQTVGFGWMAPVSLMALLQFHRVPADCQRGDEIILPRFRSRPRLRPGTRLACLPACRLESLSVCAVWNPNDSSAHFATVFLRHCWNNGLFVPAAVLDPHSQLLWQLVISLWRSCLSRAIGVSRHDTALPCSQLSPLHEADEHFVTRNGAKRRQRE